MTESQEQITQQYHLKMTHILTAWCMGISSCFLGIFALFVRNTSLGLSMAVLGGLTGVSGLLIQKTNESYAWMVLSINESFFLAVVSISGIIFSLLKLVSMIPNTVFPNFIDIIERFLP